MGQTLSVWSLLSIDAGARNNKRNNTRHVTAVRRIFLRIAMQEFSKCNQRMVREHELPPRRFTFGQRSLGTTPAGRNTGFCQTSFSKTAIGSNFEQASPILHRFTADARKFSSSQYERRPSLNTQLVFSLMKAALSIKSTYTNQHEHYGSSRTRKRWFVLNHPKSKRFEKWILCHVSARSAKMAKANCKLAPVRQHSPRAFPCRSSLANRRDRPCSEG